MRSIIAVVVFFVFIYACSRSCEDTSYNASYSGKTPVDELIKEMSNDSTFSIILYDMNVEGTFFKDYLHKYKVITQENEEPQEKITDWYEVDKSFFMANANNMGMEIASKTDGNVSKTVGPPGYGSYVGNQRYGHWVNRDGGSFWEWYGKYALFSTMFNTMMYPVRRNYWDNYRTDYYGTGRSYYGPRTGGTYRYGTNSDYARKTRSGSSWYTNKSNNSFKQRVNNMRSRSTGSGSSGYRSRGGGFGK